MKIWLFLLLLTKFVNCKNLIYSTVLFRHGARAPSNTIVNSKLMKIFSNGLGELTEKGIEDSYHLGEFLRERYVTNGFLTSPFKIQEVRFFSRAINRCLMTASAVSTAMYAQTDFGKAFRTTFVPIYSQEKNDTLLDYSFTDCQEEFNYVKETCKDVPHLSEFKTWPDYEAFIFECLQLHTKSKHFPSANHFRTAESLINEEKNGIPIDPEIADELHELYSKVFRFIIGAGEYHNIRLLRMKGGYLMQTILNNMFEKWRCFVGNCKSRSLLNQKLVAYSTQDWVIAVILEILGTDVFKEAIGQEFPNYNSMIIIELYDNEAVPEVEIYYKRGANSTELVNLTPKVRNCADTDTCHLSHFLKCCVNYTTHDPQAACMGKRH